MKRALGCGLVAVFLAAAAVDVGADGPRRVWANLLPDHEVPAVSSPASGRFSATINTDNETVTYDLAFRDLQANITQAHIHFAQPNVNGGIMVWLCGTATNPGPAGGPAAQPCPQSGTISGVIVPANIIAVTPQGIAPGEFQEFVRVLLSGFAYVNVHTAQSTGGEIRGQVRRGGRSDGDDE